MQLHNITQIETLPRANIYRAESSEPLHPGQFLIVNNQPLAVIKSETIANSHHLILQSPVAISPNDVYAINGQIIDWQIQHSVTVLTEGFGNLVAVHWLNANRKAMASQVDRVVLYAEDSFDFRPSPSQYMTPDYPSNMIASMPLLDDLGYISRLACQQFQPGCFEGSLAELMAMLPNKPRNWLGFAKQETIDELSELLGEPVGVYWTDCS